MSSPILRGVVHGNRVVLATAGYALPDGTEVVVTPIVLPRCNSENAEQAASATHISLSGANKESPFSGSGETVEPAGPRRGDPEALFAALDEVPPISDEDAAHMLRVIEEEFGQIDEDAWKD